MPDTCVPLILVADDEPGIREALQFSLEQAGFRVHCCADGQLAVQAFDECPPDLAILDIMMPRLDGIAVLRHIRAAAETLPVLFLTSRDAEFDRVLGLELGADDYLCKPFSLRELVARVRALLRRHPAGRAARQHTGTAAEQPTVGSAGQSLSTMDGQAGSGTVGPPATELPAGTEGPLCIDPQCFCARWAATVLPLTVSEFRILQALFDHPGVVFSRDQILAAAYPDERFVNDRAADGHIKRIRRKLSAAGAPDSLIETLYGAGYRLDRGALR
ncbi:MAG: response regulator transcription factor [Spirochaetes bacterium]|nr:response regulator transcription factor [Spirochaetota bacterium]MBU0956840.1 response regulator transcription factor [Spirochaetota bacterium]